MKYQPAKLIPLLLLTVLPALADSPVADWRFTKGCIDHSGNGLNGRMGGFKTAIDPESRQACAFNDGSSAKGVWMTVPDDPEFQNIDALTIIARVKALPTNRAGWLLYKPAPSGCDWGLCLNTEPVKGNEDLYRVGLKIDSVMKWFWIDRKKYPPTRWNCFAVTVDLNGDRIPRLYINGLPVAKSDSFGLDDFFRDESGTLIGTVDAYEFNGTALPHSGKPLFIGGANATKKNSFQGMITTVQLFRAALTEQELKTFCSQHPKGFSK